MVFPRRPRPRCSSREIHGGQVAVRCVDGRDASAQVASVAWVIPRVQMRRQQMSADKIVYVAVVNRKAQVVFRRRGSIVKWRRQMSRRRADAQCDAFQLISFEISGRSSRLNERIIVKSLMQKQKASQLRERERERERWKNRFEVTTASWTPGP